MHLPLVEQLRQDGLAIWQAGLEAVRADRLMQQAVRVEGEYLCVGRRRIRLASIRRIVVVGAGKAGAGMAAALEEILGRRLMEEKDLIGWVNVPADCLRPLRRIHLHPARPPGLNEPTEEGLAGTEEILRLVAALGPEDVCLCLISGGGSALLPAPIEGIGLADKLAVTRFLSAAGANIEQLNTVRKQLSRVKGGGLARSCRAGRLLSLIISDVLGDPLEVIASGPTVPDTSTPQAALEVLEHFCRRPDDIPDRVWQVLRRRAGQMPADDPLAQPSTEGLSHQIPADGRPSQIPSGGLPQRMPDEGSSNHIFPGVSPHQSDTSGLPHQIRPGSLPHQTLPDGLSNPMPADGPSERRGDDSSRRSRNRLCCWTTPAGCKVYNFIIGNNATAVRAAAQEAQRRGYQTTQRAARRSEGLADSVGVRLAQQALRMRQSDGLQCLVSGGEPVVQLVEPARRGRGGRNQQLVLAALNYLLQHDQPDLSRRDWRLPAGVPLLGGAPSGSSSAVLPQAEPTAPTAQATLPTEAAVRPGRGILLLSGGTDGEDGPTDAAGAWVDEEVIQAVLRLGLSPADFLARNDAYSFFAQTGSLIRTGPTHTNVCDLRVVLVGRNNQRPG